MPFDPAKPRESLGLHPSLCEGAALVQIELNDVELRRKHAAYRLVGLLPLYHNQTDEDRQATIIYALEPNSACYAALGIIKDLEEAGDLPEGSISKAYTSLVNGDFDRSPWYQYLPPSNSGQEA